VTDPPTPRTEGAARPSLVSHVRAVHGPGLAAAMERAVAPFGGWRTLVSPGERIAVKVNLLRAAPPGAAVTTHPETLRCILQGLKEAGARPFVADSPGGANPAAKVARAWRISGIAQVCREERVELVDVDSAPAPLACPDGRLFRAFTVGGPFLDADGIVQVGPLKTHVLMRLTGGVKLGFGCVPGLLKAQLHVRAPRREDFADMLLDLYLALQPRFTVIDGVLAMEGQGPGGGRPLELGSLFAAADAIALDAALADRTAHERASIYTLARAAGRGLIDLDDPYRTAGDPVEPFLGFLPAVKDAPGMVPAHFRRLARRSVAARPRLVRADDCTRCGDCAQICGVRAISLTPQPRIDDERCVRCYACAEICPSGALDVVTPTAARLLGRSRRRRNFSG